MVTRRYFIRVGAAVGLSGLLAKFALGAPALALDVFSSSTNFTPLLGQGFKVAAGSIRLGEVTLTEVTDAPGKVTAGASFSLLFDTSGVKPFPQSTYIVTHPALGTFAMFLSPVGQSGHTCEAVINRRNG